MKGIDLTTFGNHEILTFFSDIMEELANRGLIRSKNNPVADYAEHLVCRTFSLTAAEKSTKGYDATDANGKRYEIKSRRYSVRSKPTRFSAIRDLDTKHFDILAAVLFSQDFTVQRAVFLPYATVRRIAFRQEHVNGWILPIRDSLWSADGAVDVTDALRRTQDEEEHSTRESSP
jgi:hypothetical protein